MTDQEATQACEVAACPDHRREQPSEQPTTQAERKAAREAAFKRDAERAEARGYLNKRDIRKLAQAALEAQGLEMPTNQDELGAVMRELADRKDLARQKRAFSHDNPQGITSEAVSQALSRLRKPTTLEG